MQRMRKLSLKQSLVTALVILAFILIRDFRQVPKHDPGLPQKAEYFAKPIEVAGRTAD